MQNHNLPAPPQEHVPLGEDEDVIFRISHDPGSYVPTHWHQELELIFLLSGELEVVTGDDRYHMKQDDLLLIPSRTWHGTKCITGNDAILIQFSYPFLQKYIPNIDSLHFHLNSIQAPAASRERLDAVRQLLLRMRTVYGQSNGSKRIPFTILLFELLQLLLQDFSSDIPVPEPRKGSNQQDKLDRLIQYAKAHYREPLSIHDMASLLGIQPEYFCRFFKKHLNRTFLEYMNEIRLSHIHRDLLMTDIALHRLLEMHGFTNYKLFRRMFRQHFGVTPGVLRKRGQG